MGPQPGRRSRRRRRPGTFSGPCESPAQESGADQPARRARPGSGGRVSNVGRLTGEKLTPAVRWVGADYLRVNPHRPGHTGGLPARDLLGLVAQVSRPVTNSTGLETCATSHSGPFHVVVRADVDPHVEPVEVNRPGPRVHGDALEHVPIVLDGP